MGILIANLIVTFFTFGSGCFANTGAKANPVVTFSSWISPMKRSTEILMRVVLKGRLGEDQILENFGYTSGLTFCFCYLIGFTIAMVAIGWFILWCKNRKH